MMTKALKIAGVLIVAALSCWMTSKYVYQNTGEDKTYKYHWDERIWTSAAIADYHMFFRDYQRKFSEMDSWFTTFAIEEGIDTSKMASNEKQWYDRNMWTAGWKAHTIGKYFMGFMAVNFGGKTDPQGYFYSFDNPEHKGKTPGAYTPDKLVQLARWPNTIMNILTILLVFFIGWRYFHYIVGFVGALILSVNKNLFQVSNMAGVDAGGLFFSTLTITLALLYLEQLKKQNTKMVYVLSVLIGISFPIAVGWKFSAALVGYIAIAVFMILATMLLLRYVNPPVEKKVQQAAANLNKSKKEVKRKPVFTQDLGAIQKIRQETLQTFMKMGISAAIIAILTWVIFIYSNPILYTNPIKKVKVINESVEEFFRRRANAQGTIHLMNHKDQAFTLLVKRNFLNEDPKGVYHGTIGSYLPFKYNFLDGLLFLSGLILISISGLSKSFKERTVSPDLLIAISTVILLWGTVDFLWADFNRYYIPFYPMGAIVSGYAIWYIFNKFKVSAKKAA